MMFEKGDHLVFGWLFTPSFSYKLEEVIEKGTVKTEDNIRLGKVHQLLQKLTSREQNMVARSLSCHTDHTTHTTDAAP